MRKVLFSVRGGTTFGGRAETEGRSLLRRRTAFWRREISKKERCLPPAMTDGLDMTEYCFFQ